MREGTLVRTLCMVSVIALAAPMFFGSVSAVRDEDRLADAPTYNLYFGDLHSHTSLSDGTGTPWEAYQMGIDGGADFMAITEHVQFWNAYDAWIMDADEWIELKQAAESFTSEDFVAIPGYETWMLANCGEVNVYNVSELPPEHNLGYRYDRLPNFYDWLAEQPGAIGQFNHPLYVTDNFMDYDYLNADRDVNMCIIEAYNDVYYEESYIMALDAGWHLMPSSNSDTHAADWIMGHEMRTVLLAESLTPDSLYDAMANMRGYATLDSNLRVEYTLDGAVMGSILADSGSSCDAWIHVVDPDGAGDEITMIEIISDGGVPVATLDLTGDPQSDVEWPVTLESGEASYFYVRVTTMSPLEGEPGITAWTAPVWTGQ